jgi:nucleoside-diphosphate-sugar epimerase
VHLAALQIPFCRAKPITGAHVNVVGTVNVFEAARQMGLRHLAYASSIAAFGPKTEAGAFREPDTLYGVYKQANEGTARIYWQDYEVSSIGLRPYTVYGVGRDQGLTSEPTKAMLAAAADAPFEIAFGGRMQFHFASDVARQFIEAASSPIEGGRVFNLGGAAVGVGDIVEMIRRVRPDSRISHIEKPLPFPEEFPAEDLRDHLPATRETPIEEGVRATIAHFESLLRAGKVYHQNLG